LNSKKRITIKDIAELAGVSTVPVHKVLYGKPGIAEATREKVIELAREHNYTINSAASSLKRRTVHLAVLINEGTGEDRFFYPYLWKGIAEAETVFKDFNVNIHRYQFSGDYRDQIAKLSEILRENRSEMDGLITVAWHATELNPILEDFNAAGVPTVIFNADIEGGKRVGYVGAPAHQIGLLAGELMSNFIGSGGRVVVLGGNRMLQNHRDTAFGFYSELKTKKPDTEILELYDFYDKEKLMRNLSDLLSKLPDIRGLYCANARNTLAMCDLVRSSGLSGKIKVIGSDVFEELRPYFKDNTIQATIWQNPRQQAYKAVELMYRYITKQPFREKEYVNIGIVMKNNFDFFL